MIKTFFSTIAVGSVLLVFSAAPAMAQGLGAQSLLKSTGRLENVASHSAVADQTKLSTLIKRADQMISVRLSSLSQLSDRVQKDQRLSADEKTSLNADIQTDSAGLNSLKTKIDADTDFQSAQTDTRSIISSYKVFAIFEPKMRMLITLNNLQTSVKNTQASAVQIQALINTMNTQGKDTSKLSALLDDINSELQSADTTISGDITALEAVTPQSTDYQSTFTKVKGDIKTITNTDFAKIRGDITQMRVDFRLLILPENSTHPSSASASTTSSVNVNP